MAVDGKVENETPEAAERAMESISTCDRWLRGRAVRADSFLFRRHRASSLPATPTVFANVCDDDDAVDILDTCSGCPFVWHALPIHHAHSLTLLKHELCPTSQLQLGPDRHIPRLRSQHILYFALLLPTEMRACDTHRQRLFQTLFP